MVKTSASSSSSYTSNVNNVVSSNSNEVKYKGVRKRKWGKYVSEIRLPNSRDRIWLGSYDSAEKAARAFDAALFCLRGRNASFNFRDDPPNIPDGQSLNPAQIQAVAQQYANNYSGGGGSSARQPQPPEDKFRARAVELSDTSPSSNSEGAGPIDSIDWSFLDMLDSNTEASMNAGNVSDFGLFHEPGDMFIPPHFASRDDDDDNDDGDDHGNGGNMSSFLWSF